MTRWLSGLSAAELAAVMVRRPEAAAAPVPRTIGDLANRLCQHHHVMTAVHGLCAPAVQLIEAVQSRLAPGSDGVPTGDLADLVGCSPADPELAAALEVLYQRALAWPVEDSVVLAGPLRNAFAYPLGLGRPAAALLVSRPADEVRRIGERLGIRLAGRPKAAAVDAVAARLAEPDAVRELVAGAPEDLAVLLRAVAAAAPVVQGEFGYLPAEFTWAVERGLLVSDGWEHAEMPREVSLALRDPAWRAPFTPRPPLPPLAVADPEAVEREAAAAAGGLLSAATAVLDAAPVKLLKAGGVGSRELKRVGQATGVPAAEVGLLVELAVGAEVLAETADEVLPTPEYDRWVAEPPGARLASLIDAWCDLPVGRPGTTPLRTELLAPDSSRLRHLLLSMLADIGGALPAGGTLLPSLLAWHAPLVLDLPDGAAAAVCGQLWAEAVTLGLVARGALSPLGRAVVDGSDLVAAADKLVSAPAENATFQTDLTAVVSGAPSAELSRLLDSCADREARGAASVWRFTPASVRRALDTGATADQLIDGLRAAGTLPQAVEYLIHDIARRHGSLRVRAVGCVLHGVDPALLAEVVADRRLAALGLTALTPTVLAGSRPPADTLAALRAAGYAPIGEDTTGEVVPDVPAQRRAERQVTVRRVRRRTPSVRPADAAVLAAKLLAAPPSAEPVVEQRGPDQPRTPLHLPADEIELLFDALAEHTPVRISYVDGAGRHTERLVEPIEVENGNRLIAHCHLRDDERAFVLSRIASVSPP